MTYVLPLLCFAVDPGPTYTGFSMLRLDAKGFLVLVEGFHRRWDPRIAEHRNWFSSRVREVVEAGGIVAIESVIGVVFQASRAAQLFETSQIEGELRMLSRVNGAEPLEIPAGDASRLDRDAVKVKRPKKVKGAPPVARVAAAKMLVKGWRGELCNNSRASDKQIEVVVEGIVGGSGSGGFKSSEAVHIYDATGLGVVAIFRTLGRVLRLPPKTAAALALQATKDKVTYTEKRAKRAADKAAGLVSNRRRPTRAQKARQAAGKTLAS